MRFGIKKTFLLLKYIAKPKYLELKTSEHIQKIQQLE